MLTFIFLLPQESFLETGRIGERWTLGAWADALYYDTSRQGQDSFVNLSHLYIQLNYQMQSSWRIFGELEYENLPSGKESGEEEIEMERLFVEFKPDWWGLRLGKFDTQAGIVKPIHWKITLDTISSPIMEINSYIPAKTVGLEWFASKPFRQGEWVFSGNISDSDAEVTDEEPINRAKGIGVDARFRQPGRFLGGVSGHFYRDPKDKDQRVTAFLPFLEWTFHQNRLVFRSEYLYLHRQNSSDIQSIYGKLKWNLNADIYLNLRIDTGDDERIANGRDLNVQSLTYGHWFHPKVRFKAEHAWSQIQGGPSFREWAMSIGVIFL